MLIRSVSKNHLVNIEKCKDIYIDIEHNGNAVVKADSISIGEYSSAKNALEALNSISDAYQTDCWVFDMPTNKEVGIWT